MHCCHRCFHRCFESYHTNTVECAIVLVLLYDRAALDASQLVKLANWASLTPRSGTQLRLQSHVGTQLHSVCMRASAFMVNTSLTDGGSIICRILKPSDRKLHYFFEIFIYNRARICVAAGTSTYREFGPERKQLTL